MDDDAPTSVALSDEEDAMSPASLSEVNPLEAMLGDDWHGRIQKDLELKAQSQKDVELKAQSQKDVELKAQSKENDAELKAQSNEQVVDQNAQSKVTPPWRSMTSEVPSQADVCEVPPWGQARRRAKRAREQDEPAEEQAPFTKEVEEPAEEQAPEPKQEVEEQRVPAGAALLGLWPKRMAKPSRPAKMDVDGHTGLHAKSLARPKEQIVHDDQLANFREDMKQLAEELGWSRRALEQFCGMEKRKRGKNSRPWQQCD